MSFVDDYGMARSPQKNVLPMSSKQKREAYMSHRRAQSMGTWFGSEQQQSPNNNVAANSPSRRTRRLGPLEASERVALYKASVAHNATMANNNGGSGGGKSPRGVADTRYGSLQKRSGARRHERAAHETHRRFRSWAAPAVDSSGGGVARSLQHVPSASFAPPVRDPRRPRAGTGEHDRVALAHSFDRSLHAPPLLTRKSSLEQLAELEAFVESKQRELKQRGEIPADVTSARIALRQKHAASGVGGARNARRRALATKLDDLEEELELMRQRTSEIVERVERLEAERSVGCRAPDVIEMEAGRRVHQAPASASRQADGRSSGQQTRTVLPAKRSVPQSFDAVHFSTRLAQRDDLVTPEPTRSITPQTDRSCLSPSGQFRALTPSPATAFAPAHKMR